MSEAGRIATVGGRARSAARDAHGGTRSRTSESSPPSTLSDGAIPAGAVAALALSGLVKASGLVTWFPIDITLLSAAVVLALVAARLIVDGGRTRVPHVLALLVATYVAPGLFVGDTQFANEARLGVVLALLCAVGATYFVSSRAGLLTWLVANILVGILQSAALWSMGAPASDMPGNSIATGQASGVACAIIVVLIARRAIPVKFWPAAAVAAIGLATVMIRAGSRGALLAAAAAIVVAILPVSRHRLARAGAAALALVGANFILNASTNEGATRLQAALAGRFDNTASRDHLWESAATSIPLHPFGIGWGNFETVLLPVLSDVRHYPHNLVLQTYLEGGWLAGVATIAFVCVSLCALWKRAEDPLIAATLAVAVFYLTAAMFSGSLGDNRMLYAALGVGLGRYISRIRIGGDGTS